LAVLAAALCAAVALLSVLSTRRLRADSVPAPALGEGSDPLSVIVAAHDEEPRIGALVATLLAQDHPDFEVLVVDDRSRDATGRAVEKAAAGDPRVRVIRVDARPEGWQGRLWAQGVGVGVARGEWILFLSADQRLRSPTFLRAMVARYRAGSEAAVAVVGPFGGRHWWHRLLFQPLANNPLVWGTLLLVQASVPGSRWLIGALGMRRSTYFELGGVREAAICGAGAYDDMGWAKLLRLRGFPARMVYHAALEDDSNWETFGEFWHGVTRWAAGFFTYRTGGWVFAGLLAGLVALGLGASASVCSSLAHGRTPGLAAVLLAACPAIGGIAHCVWNRRPLLYTLVFYPVGAAFLAMVLGGVWARVRNRVVWRDQVVRVRSPQP
jgi:glycosyltransferase involved in cell wall biosynthesis